MMKRSLTLACALGFCVSTLALAQDDNNGSGGQDILSGLWNLEDATPIDTGKVDLRFGFSWVTEDAPGNNGDSDDDFVLTPTIVWGSCENVEVSLSLPIWLGDGGDAGPFDDGNADTYLGVLWRFHEQVGHDQKDGYWLLPSMALSGTFRIPTGDNSEKIDAELRLILTNDHGNGLRSHFNVFGKSVNGNNQRSSGRGFHGNSRSFGGFGSGLGLIGNNDDLDARDFQWGFVLGMDGPLCGESRWIANYMHRSSEFNGRSDINLAELGVEWSMSDAQTVGMSMQIGLDSNEDTPNFGIGLMYSHSLGM